MHDTVGWEPELDQPEDQRYRGNGSHKWEGVVPALAGFVIHRLRVPGGWIYRDNSSGALVFVPMPGVVKHKV